MFEDSLVESTGGISTRSKWFAMGSFILQAAVVAALVLIPFLHPAALPKQALTLMLAAPPPPPAPAEVLAHATSSRSATPAMLTAITVPSVVPGPIRMVRDAPPGPVVGRNGGGLSDVIGAMNDVGTSPPPGVKPEPRSKPRPFRISSGVAIGRLLCPDPAGISGDCPGVPDSGNRRC